MASQKLKNHQEPWLPADLKKMRALVEGIRFQAINQPKGVQKRLAKSGRRASR